MPSKKIMAWTYEQSTGKFTDPNGKLQAKGYSGQPPHVNNPDSQFLHDFGPIPEGYWQAVEMLPESSHGPFAIRLEPYPNTNTFGRSGFFIHGERLQPPVGFASEGCMILSRDIREMFWQSSDHDVLVVR